MVFPTDNLHRILFIDIETATLHSDFGSLNDELKKHWQIKFDRYLSYNEAHIKSDYDIETYYNDRAAIYAEYAKVICISVGYIKNDKDSYNYRIKTFSNNDEAKLLTEFSELLNEFYFDRFNQFLCGHNIKEFDIPFICRRMVINRLPLPNLLNIAGMKPWQASHLLDTMDLWKYGDYKHYTSLDLLCAALDIDSPKSNISGKDVSKFYWDGNIDKIVSYCEGDVRATIEVYLICLGLKSTEPSK